MPKKKRKNGQAVPDRPDKFQWTCRKCKPPAVIKGATEKDVKDGRVLHMMLVHFQ